MRGDADEFEAKTARRETDISATAANRNRSRGGASRPPSRWIIGGAVALIVAALVGLFVAARSSTDTARNEAALSPAVAPTNAPNIASSTIAPTASAPPRAALDLQESAAAQLRPPTAATDPARPEPTAAAAPLLGEPSGLWLFYGGEDHLQRLDLDTATVDTFGVRAVPIAATGGELVLMTHDSGAVGWVALGDPNEQGDGWIDARIADDPVPGFLWRYNLGDETWTRLDLASGLIVERRSAPRQVFPELRTDFRQPTVPGPDLVTTPSGLYEYRGTAYVRVGSGTVFAYTGTEALIESCAETLELCVTSWVDRASFEPSNPLPSPLPPGRLHAAQFVARGSWLHLLYAGGGSYLVSTSSDRVIEIADDTTTITVSPDGEWLARGTERGTVEVVRLASGRTVATLDVFVMREGGALLFVGQ